jgi:hypothetical protein
LKISRRLPIAYPKGTLEHCDSSHAHGELAELVNTFNRMIDALAAKTREARDLNELLERKVDARTAELEAVTCPR